MFSKWINYMGILEKELDVVREFGGVVDDDVWEDFFNKP